MYIHVLLAYTNSILNDTLPTLKHPFLVHIMGITNHVCSKFHVPKLLTKKLQVYYMI